jgi:hypothetical protein
MEMTKKAINASAELQKAKAKIEDLVKKL